MESIRNLQLIISDAFKQLEFNGSPAELYDPIGYTLSLGGKRLRPTLVLAACDLLGGNINEAIRPAMAMELFHNFTLLHDDLMDQAPLRRGKETVYKKWNPNIAILAGDTLFALANRMMLQTRREVIPELMDLFNTTAIEVCEGQQLDMNFESSDLITIPDYIEMIRLKTAVLLAASLKTGAVIAGAENMVANLLYEFGINLGIGFQLMDDLLDVYGSEEKFGKKPGGDILACKKTYLYLKGLELAGNRKEEFAGLYHSNALEPTVKINRVRSHFDEVGIMDSTNRLMDQYWNKAVESLQAAGLPDEKTQPMIDFCSGLMKRDN